MSDLRARAMRPDEYERMRAVSVAAFDDEDIGVLIDALRASWAWEDALSFSGTLVYPDAFWLTDSVGLR